jgi:hypothetical protein
LFHLLQEHLLACFFGVEVEVQASLFHRQNFQMGLTPST